MKNILFLSLLLGVSLQERIINAASFSTGKLEDQDVEMVPDEEEVSSSDEEETDRDVFNKLRRAYEQTGNPQILHDLRYMASRVEKDDASLYRAISGFVNKYAKR